MERIFALLTISSATSGLTIRNDDDFVDRLSHRYSCFLLIMFALVISAGTWVGDPINCWVPAHFTSNYEDYTNKVCWVSNTYYLPMANKDIPEPEEPRQIISYYQWTPFILLFQALFFRLPCSLWRFMNPKVGIELNDIIRNAVNANDIRNAESRDLFTRYIVTVMRNYFKSMRNPREARVRVEEPSRCVQCLQCCRQNCLSKYTLHQRRRGHYLVWLYIFCKFLYTVNALAQIFVLNAFLRTNYIVYGMEVVKKIIDNAPGAWSISERFPRVTLCDFEIRRIGATLRHTVQCVLPINLFNEKIFIFVWFWCSFVALMSFCSLIKWFVHSTLPLERYRYIRKHVKPHLTKQQEWKPSKRKFTRFVTSYLKPDGVLALRLLEHNSCVLLSEEVVISLWREYLQEKNNIEGRREQPDDV